MLRGLRYFGNFMLSVAVPTIVYQTCLWIGHSESISLLATVGGCMMFVLMRIDDVTGKY